MSKYTVTPEGWFLLGIFVITGIFSMIRAPKPVVVVEKLEKPKEPKKSKPFTISNIPNYKDDLYGEH